MAQAEAKPYAEKITEEGYIWHMYSEDVTGQRMAVLEDPRTGSLVSTVVPNTKVRVAAHTAWLGARESRAPGLAYEIAQEMGQKGINPDQKLEETFTTYGHLSVGDMAKLPVWLDRVPMHLAAALFNITATNDGQEKSTRYQPQFKKAALHPIKNYLPKDLPEAEGEKLEGEYQSFGEQSLEYFAKNRELLTPAFRAFFKPDEGSKSQEAALNSRVLDSARFFLLFGQTTGMMMGNSAREWSRMISQLKASPVSYYGELATQLEHLLAPSKEEEKELGYLAGAPSLVRHAEADNTTNSNLEALYQYLQRHSFGDFIESNMTFRGFVEPSSHLIDKQYSAVEKMVAQYLLTLSPGLESDEALEWVTTLGSGRVAREISEIIFKGHSNYKELPPLARTTELTAIMKGSIGDDRDWNRHRALGRFMPLPLVYGLPWDLDTASKIVARGYNLPLYLTDIPEFSEQWDQFDNDLESYYKNLYRFMGEVAKKYGDSIDYGFVVNLLPLAHQMDLWMHGDPKSLHYMTYQRIRPGGHINYRMQAYDINRQLAATEPYLQGMALAEEPDPAGREEFFNRS